MRSAQIQAGAFYTDEKMGVRQVLDVGEHVKARDSVSYPVGVRYRVCSSSKAPEIGTESTVALASFYNWGRRALTAEQAKDFILSVEGRKAAVRLTAPQRAFFQGIGEMVTPATSIECSRKESRLLKALHAKGFIAAVPEFSKTKEHCDIQLTGLGVAVLAAILKPQAAELPT
ncbi:hypothetical protein [Geopseudomonas aromaticivorans]